MYISGTLNTFENRLHQLPINTGDLFYFRTEDNSYFFNTGQKQHINKEYQRKYFSITRDASYLTGWYLTADEIASLQYPLDYIESTYGTGKVNFAYSFRKLSTGYNGPILLATDGTNTLPMYAGEDGELIVTGMSIFGNSYVGVRTFYDQSNNGRHISTVLTSPSAIFYTGAPVYFDNKICGFQRLNGSGTYLKLTYTGANAISGSTYTGAMFRDFHNTIYASYSTTNGANTSNQVVISEHGRRDNSNFASVGLGCFDLSNKGWYGTYATWRNNNGSTQSATSFNTGGQVYSGALNSVIVYNGYSYINSNNYSLSSVTGLSVIYTGSRNDLIELYLFGVRTLSATPSNLFSGYFRETISFNFAANPTGLIR